MLFMFILLSICIMQYNLSVYFRKDPIGRTSCEVLMYAMLHSRSTSKFYTFFKLIFLSSGIWNVSIILIYSQLIAVYFPHRGSAGTRCQLY